MKRYGPNEASGCFLLPCSRSSVTLVVLVVSGILLFWILPGLRESSLQVTHRQVSCKKAPHYWPSSLVGREFRVFSQNGEDGILAAIFNFIGTTNKFYVEFGTESGVECNTRLLRERGGWRGLLMDGGNENHTIGLYKEFITPENINSLLAKYGVLRELDLLSIDVNFDDWFVWRSVSSQYRPRVVIIEYNAAIPAGESRTIDPKDTERWPGKNGTTDYFGASLKALYDLGRSIGYSLVTCDRAGVNAVFVRDDILECQKATLPPFDQIYVHNPFPHNRPETSPHRHWLLLDERAQVVGRVPATSLLPKSNKHAGNLVRMMSTRSREPFGVQHTAAKWSRNGAWGGKGVERICERAEQWGFGGLGCAPDGVVLHSVRQLLLFCSR